MKPSKSQTRHVVLGFLGWRPWSGYDIKRLVETSVSHFWSESYGQIYPTLQRLVEEGLTEPVQEREADGRGRQPYAVTAAGRRELERWLGEPFRQTPPRNEFLLKLFFSGHGGPDLARTHVERFRAQAVAELARLEGIERDLPDQRRGHRDLPYWLLTVRYGIGELRAHLAWSEEALRSLDRLAARRPDEESEGANDEDD